MKNPRTSEEMLAVANKYALTEEATHGSKDSKKGKKPSQSGQPGTSKSNDKKRKSDRSIANVERPHHNRTEYRPRPGEYEGFLDGICIFHPKESVRLESATSSKVLLARSLS
jgi:hypothetical protein